MTRMMTVAMATVLGLASAAPAGEKPAVTVKVCGVQVTAPGYGKGFEGLQPLNTMEPGTRVAVLVQPTAGSIVKFDTNASKITKMTDEKGTDLLKAPAGRRSRFGMGPISFPRVSKDAKACMATIVGPQRPAKGATTVLVQGTFVLSCADGKKTVRQNNVALTNGTKVTAGDVVMTLSDVGKPKWGDAALSVNFQGDEKMDSIASMTFLDAAGKPIEARRASRSHMTMMGKAKVEHTYTFKKKVAVATIQIALWQNLRQVKAPIDLKVGVGL